MAHVRPGQKGLEGLSLRAVLNKKKSCTRFSTKKSVTSFFIGKKSVPRFFIFLFCRRSRIKKSVSRVTLFFGVGRVAKKA